ncbi:class I mannose-6-phosphate isomerase [Sphingobium sp. OAS761]|uniref:class I mannose-6-phosphate isomerase n=1 Tax=Sphingobium sp. OAS761 TaxID=2817901 RepID=UPI00345FAC0F
MPDLFGDAGGRRIGEMWFEADDGPTPPLLVKYLATSERLSIQVHPDDRQAREAGLSGGKQEIWYILDCNPGAVLGIGLREQMSPERFRAAAVDGSIESMIDWKPVRPGDCYFIPPGTVHAIGAGIVLAEIQQNRDVTYRLYDYGRARELHLEEGLSVSSLTPYDRVPAHVAPDAGGGLISPPDAPFRLEFGRLAAGATMTLPASGPTWFIPIEGNGTIGEECWARGECWLCEDAATVTADHPSSILLATMA